MKKDKKQSRLERTVINEESITLKQKKKIFKVLGKKYPVGKVAVPIKNSVAELAVSINGKIETLPFPVNECSTRLKTLLKRIKPKGELTVGEAVEILQNGRLERLKGCGGGSVIELSVKLKSILLNQLEMKNQKGAK